MDLKHYFKKANGFGVLSTADDKGKVDAAVFAQPHVIDDGHIAFLMNDRLSYANITMNPYAVYLYKEDAPDFVGQRFYLKKEKETKDPETLKRVCDAEWPGPYCSADYLKGCALVYFSIESVLPLVL